MKTSSSGVFQCLIVAASLLADVAWASDDVIGAPSHYTARASDTLLRVAREHDLGFVELLTANPGIDPWLPGAGTKIRLPSDHVLPNAPRVGLVINLAEQRLYHFARQGALVSTYPIATGRAGWETPTGRTHIVGKRKDPAWMPPASIRRERPELPMTVAPGPGNPLGRFALDLGWSGYVIHGTNKPMGIGRRVSHGCIRLYPEDIGQLFALVTIGTPVMIVDQPVKLGWSEGELYLEVHPTQSQADELEKWGTFAPEPAPGLEDSVQRAAGSKTDRVIWNIVRRTARERRGTPVRITR